MLQEIEADAGEMWPQLDSEDLPLDNVAARRSIARFLAAIQVRSMRLCKLQKSTIELRDKLGLLRPDYQDPWGWSVISVPLRRCGRSR